MFRVHYIKFHDHPILKELEIDFNSEKELKESEGAPYVSVLIGMNGTGKSRILRAISDIFYNIDKNYFVTENPKIYFGFHIRYSLNGNIYDLFNHRITSITQVKKEGRTSVQLHFLKNRPLAEPLYEDILLAFKTDPKYQCELRREYLPKRVIASTTQLNDRFIFADNEKSALYHYLGIKNTARSISTKSFERKTVGLIFEATDSSSFKPRIKNILTHLGLGEHFKIVFKTSKHYRFFIKDLDLIVFEEYYEKYLEFRKTEPWGAWKYKQLKKEDPERLTTIINFIKELIEIEFMSKIKNSSSKFLSIDLLNDKVKDWDLTLIQDLAQLDLIHLQNIEIKKLGSTIPLSESSAGEYQIIMSLLGLFSKIEQNALVLIDEPEISLHPNWQMSYVKLLTDMFSTFTKSQFIIATHSHLLVSSLESKHSSLNVLSKSVDNGIVAEPYENTYGWSAEQVLLDVFGVPTTRNFFIADKIGEILELISHKSRDENLINTKVQNLVKLNLFRLSSNDPLYNVWLKIIEKYG